MPFAHADLLNYGPVPFWFWNDKVTEPELRRQIRLMRQGGVRNFIIHARWGLKTPYLGAEWWRLIKAAVDEAKLNGSRSWLYDEYNYPSGIAGFKLTKHERFRERFLEPASVEVSGGRQAELRLPPGKPVAVFAYPIGAKGLDLERAVDLGPMVHGGRVRFRPGDTGRWLLSAFCERIEPFRGSGRYSVNYLAPEPTQEFIRLTHEAYKKHLGKDLGGVAPAFFLDEPRFNNALPWDERFLGWFRKRYAYELGPRLALLLHPGSKGEASALRQDYYGLCGELYAKHFFEPIGRWCRQHKVQLTGHLMAEETLAGSTRFSADGLKPYRHFTQPGCDHLGKGIGGLAPKIASSAAHLAGADRVSCEAFAGCGQDFGLEEMNTITHWLFAEGVNLIVPHAFFYARRTQRQIDDWPPSMFFQWEHWAQYPAYAQRVARLSEALSGGRSVADIALYHPTKEFQGAYVADPSYKTGYFKKGPTIQGATALSLERWFQTLGQSLRNRHHDFHVLPSDAFKRLGDYKVLLLPTEAQLSPAVWRQVAAFMKRGGKVLLGSAASTLRGLDRALGTPDIVLKGCAGLQGRVLEWDDRIHDPYLHQNLDAVLAKGLGGVTARHYRKGKVDTYFLANLTRSRKRFKARLRCTGKRVELRWPATGCVENAQVKRQGKVSVVEMDLPALESVLVVLQP